MYSLKIGNEEAMSLTQNGAMVLILGLPQETVFGVDCAMFVVWDSFFGVKMIPPGPHFVTTRAAASQSYVPVIGQFVYLEKKQVLVLQWDSGSEQLVSVADKDQEFRLQEGARRFDFDAGMAPYNLNTYSSWIKLSDHITAKTIQRIQPLGGKICVMNEEDREGELAWSQIEKQLLQQFQDCRISDFGKWQKAEIKRCYYVDIVGNIKKKGMSAAELTQANMDKTEVLDKIIDQQLEGEPNELVGELQFAFLAFWLCQSLQGFNQWKRIVRLLLQCERGPLQSHTQLFVKLLRALRFQLKQFGQPEKAMQDSLLLDNQLYQSFLKNSFLIEDLNCFEEILNDFEQPPQHDLMKEVNKILEIMQNI